ncbi:MAG: glutamate racemase [Alphaproteobacteria bacterium]|nr:glutamate racemase [Alphaproteobacteria bacterium]
MNLNKVSPIIGIFDSGIGGLTVLKALCSALPQYNFLYLADFGYAPYGNRTEEDIVQRSKTIVHWMEKRGVSLVVAACHTSTSVLTEEHTAGISTPIVTMLEPTLDGILHHPNRTYWKKGIAILGTALTIQKGTLAVALQSHGFDLPIYPVACPSLAGLIESCDAQSVITYLKSHVFESFARHPVDMMVYGCTHYPLMEPWLLGHDTPHILRMDPAEHVARAVGGALSVSGPVARGDTTPRVCFYHTGTQQGPEQLAKHWPNPVTSTHTQLV